MNKYIDNLKRQAQENPMAALAVAAVVITAITKLMQANNDRQNSQTWKREVDRRRMNTK
jgi:hypothetical protein